MTTVAFKSLALQLTFLLWHIQGKTAIPQNLVGDLNENQKTFSMGLNSTRKDYLAY